MTELHQALVRQGRVGRRHVRQHEARLEVIARRTIGVGAINFGIIAMLTRLDTEGPAWADVMVYVLAALAFVSAAIWLCSRMLVAGAGARVFGVFADLGSLAVMLTVSAESAVVGCALFAVTGAFMLFYLPRAYLIAHLVFAATVTIAFTAQAVADGAGVIYMSLCADVVLVSVVSTTMTMQVAWATMRRRADMAETDPLTGIRNMRGMWRDALPLFAGSAVVGDVVVVAVADIDGFKAVNDAYGHDVGDLVLVHVAHRLADHVGEVGYVARSGGEEFTLVVGGPVDVVRDVVGSIPTEFRAGDDTPIVTMSVGAALAEPAMTASERDVARAAQRQADRMMYEVKRSGGNSVGVGF